MESARVKSATRDKLLEAATGLFLERGYNATTVDDICARARVSKGSFYHFFESKEAFGLEVLQAYYENGIARLLQGPFLEEPEPRARLRKFLEQTEADSQQIWGKGCLLGTFANDLAQTNPVVRNRVATLFDRIVGHLSMLFEAVAKEEGPDRPSGRELAENYLAVLEGSIVMAQAFGDPARIQKGLERFRRQLQLNR